MLKIGEKAPDFCLPNQEENKICLEDHKNNWVVLYFYPKDNSKSCTLEALNFTSMKDKFSKFNAEIIGISKDSVKSHNNFIKSKKLKVNLLSDSEVEVQKKYGVWRKKKFMGREYTGTVRSTFLIDPNGKIAKIWDRVRVKGHVEEVLNELKNLNK